MKKPMRSKTTTSGLRLNEPYKSASKIHFNNKRIDK